MRFLGVFFLSSCLVDSTYIPHGSHPTAFTTSFTTFTACHTVRFTDGEMYNSLTSEYLISPDFLSVFCSNASLKPRVSSDITSIKFLLVEYIVSSTFCPSSFSTPQRHFLESLPQPTKFCLTSKSIAAFGNFWPSSFSSARRFILPSLNTVRISAIFS